MDSLPVNSKEVKRETLRDPLLKLVYEMTMIGWLENVEQEDLKAYFLGETKYHTSWIFGSFPSIKSIE